MSMWTYITGTVTVCPPGNSQAQMRYVLDTVLNHLPVVYGSEQNMKWHVVQKYGHNLSNSTDEFGVDIYKKNNVNKSDWMEMQCEYIIVLEASLRDTYFEDTVRGFNKWLCRLAKRVSVVDICVKITNGNYDGSKKLVIDDASPYDEMYEDYSWVSDRRYGSAEKWEGKRNRYQCEYGNWCEFMMYDGVPGNEAMPMKLFRKYWENKEIDEELERREKWEKEWREKD